MIKSAVTISLVPEARGGPFVFWDDLEAACRKASELGFDGLEIFAPDAATLQRAETRKLLGDHGLKLAAAGTGAGWVKHKLTLTHPDASVRRRATDFIRSIIEAAGALGAPAIVGSMQGRLDPDGLPGTEWYAVLRDALVELGQAARAHRVPLLFEPLNRYETNIFNRVGETSSFLARSKNTKVLADLFHMNIEEADVAAAIRTAPGRIGHVHFADSNRRPVGLGHTNMSAVAAALESIRYDGYVSAECLPYFDPDAAARQTIESFRKFFR
jgi:sugar phosphate isomerase/epimerase